MGIQSAAGKRAWKRRAGGYAAELRDQIERESSARFTGWHERGRQPAWFRINRILNKRH